MLNNIDVDPSLVKIYNIEAAPTALPGFDPELVEYAMQVLTKKGVTFRIGTAIKECTADGVIVGEGEEIKAATVVWTGGVRGNRLIEEAGIRNDARHELKLTIPCVFPASIISMLSAIIPSCLTRKAVLIPPTAQIAMQQGVTVRA